MRPSRSWRHRSDDLRARAGERVSSRPGARGGRAGRHDNGHAHLLGDDAAAAVGIGYRDAYVWNGLIVLPVVLLLIPATAFLFLFTSAVLVYIAVLIALVDLATTGWAMGLFDRERLMSRRCTTVKACA